MRLRVCAVGRLGTGPERALVEDYAARLARTGRALSLGPLEVVEVEAGRGGRTGGGRAGGGRTGGGAGGAGRETEGALLARAVPEGARLAALDERGRMLSSDDLAALLAFWRDEGARDAAFLIGGADGLDPALRARADLTLSFGPMVWPHKLARAMLAEQLYRATTILAGGPYHRG